MCNTDIKKQQQEGAVTDSDYADRNRLKHIEASLRTKYKHKIFNKFVQAICDFDLVRPDDKIAVCISGGKDSSAWIRAMRNETGSKSNITPRC